jgi:hypothetical protein
MVLISYPDQCEVVIDLLEIGTASAQRYWWAALGACRRDQLLRSLSCLRHCINERPALEGWTFEDLPPEATQLQETGAVKKPASTMNFATTKGESDTMSFSG